MQRLFNPDACKDLDAVFELRIPRKDGRTDVLALDVTYGHLEVRPGAAANAGAWVSIGGDDMVRLVSGVEPWPQMLADGRLELGGDPFLALRFPVVFKLPSGEP